MNDSLQSRIYDRADIDWLTPSQKRVWESLQRFDGPPHRVVNVYGQAGSGKTFLGKLLERLNYATYYIWPDIRKPQLSRLILDDIVPSRTRTREVRPMVDKYPIQQIILLSNIRVDERDMPAFELQVTEDDIDYVRALLYRHFNIIVPEEHYLNYKQALASLP
jgi:hypothetical protein